MDIEVKICGVTRVEDALASVELGAGFVGLNFFPPSPRCLTPARAREIADAVRGRALLVGVFVDRPRTEVEAIDAAVGLDLLQFHGDEPPEDLAPFPGRAIKVFRTDGGGLESVEFARYPGAWGFLFDIRHPKLYGGTGAAWPWGRAAPLTGERPVFVAGGIGPCNARRAAEESRAYGIDVCSGVESRPGIKDPGLLRRLFGELRDG